MELQIESHAVLFIVAALALPSSSFGAGDAFCDQGLRGLLDGPRAYQLRDGNRCEGEYAQQVNSGLLEVRSFLAAEVNFDSSAVGELFVSWDRPPRKTASVNLRGSSLRQDLYYRMDTAIADPKTEFEWNLDVIANLNVMPRDLGAVCWAAPEDRPEERVYLPLTLGQGEPRPASDTLRLVVIANYEISTLFVKVRRAAWPGSKVAQQEVVEEHEPDDFGFPAKQPIEIILDRPEEAGTFTVEIGFKYDDNTGTVGELTGTDEILFYSVGGRGATPAVEVDR